MVSILICIYYFIAIANNLFGLHPDWMTETATKPTNKARNKQPTYKPQYDLSAFIKFPGNQKSFDAFVKCFLIKAYSKAAQDY